jgi:hypothetical protein
MEIIKLNVKGFYFYSPDLQIENYEKHLNKKKLLNECAICKRFIMESSYDSITNNSKIIAESEITIGKCGHMFHSECIGSWLKSNNICPIDKVSWQTFRVADTVTKLILNESKTTNKKFEKHKFYPKNYEKKIQTIKSMAKQSDVYPGEINKIAVEENEKSSMDTIAQNYSNYLNNSSSIMTNWNDAVSSWGYSNSWENADNSWATSTSTWEEAVVNLSNNKNEAENDYELPPLADDNIETVMEYVD